MRLHPDNTVADAAPLEDPDDYEEEEADELISVPANVDFGDFGTEQGHDGGDEIMDEAFTETDSEGEFVARITDRPKPRFPKQHICTVEGCGRKYKNPGGLRYHISHAHPDPDSAAARSDFHGRHGKRGKNVPDIYKPYRCLADGCGKRYKNVNGLVGCCREKTRFPVHYSISRQKYHVEHQHTDIANDPDKMNIPFTLDRDGRPKYTLSACFDPVLPETDLHAALATIQPTIPTI